MPGRVYRSLVLTTLGVALLASCSDSQDASTAPAPTATTASADAPSAPTPTPGGDASTATPSAASPSPSPSASSTAATKVIAISFADGKAKPGEKRVEVPRGARVSLKVTSDVADEMHVHGYDRLADLKANGTTTLTFKATKAGLYEVEAEDAGTVLVQLLVR